MNIAQKLQELLDIYKMSRSKLAREIGVHTSTVSNWLDGKDAKSENLAMLCSYFGCSMDYLTSSTSEKEKLPIPELRNAALEMQKETAPALTEKDKRDVAQEVEEIMENLSHSGQLMFDGVPMSEAARAAMAAAMRVGLEEARRQNKETYTPKRYRKTC